MVKTNSRHPNQGKAVPYFYESIKLETDDCIIWRFAKSWNGYGQIDVDGKTRRVHRLVLEKRIGASPPHKRLALHSCNNRLCFNYRHLRWADAKENMADKLKDGKSQIGELNGNSKLSTSQVKAIRSDNRSQRLIAKAFGISQATVNDIKLYKVWKHV